MCVLVLARMLQYILMHLPLMINTAVKMSATILFLFVWHYHSFIFVCFAGHQVLRG
jgi:hypothetical protein